MEKPLKIKNFPGGGPLDPFTVKNCLSNFNPPPLIEKLDPPLEHVNHRVALYKRAGQSVRGETGVDKDWPRCDHVVMSCQPRWYILHSIRSTTGNIIVLFCHGVIMLLNIQKYIRSR